MKIDDKIMNYISSSELENIRIQWKNTAIDMSIEYGIFISVQLERSHYTARYNHFIFSAMGHTFESLKDLRAALDNKAFL